MFFSLRQSARCAAVVALLSACTAITPTTQTATQRTERFTSETAGFEFAYPAGSIVQESRDAALAYPVVFVQFPVTDTQSYQGASIVVIDGADTQRINTSDSLALPTGIAKRWLRNETTASEAAAVDYAAQSVTVSGSGVLYRINLFGGGVGGDSEPSPQALAHFDALLQSFRFTGQALQPQTRRMVVKAAQSAQADAFSYPLRDNGGINYGVPVGRVLNNTRMEWLDYAIRNLDQWKIKCYNVDWSRMLHTGEDWYRLDYLTADSAGTPVYAVADGVVVRHSPGLSYPGNVVVIRHTLPEGRNVFSMYGHVANVSVIIGDSVTRGQQIATVFNQGNGYVGRTPSLHPSWDSHLHFEMRWIQDAGNIYEPGTNAYNYNYPACTWAYPGRGYTYRISPNNYPYPDAGYVDPSDFINARLPPGVTALAEPVGIEGAAQITPSQPLTYVTQLPMLFKPAEPRCENVLVNGGFEANTVWSGIANTSGVIYNEAVYSNVRARNGARSGRIGSATVNGFWNEILQTAVLPTSTITATLSVWRYLDTSEVSTSASYDNFRLGVESDFGIEIVPPRRIDNTSAGRSAWVQESLTFSVSVPISPTQSSIWVTFKGTTDANRPSSLYVDDVELIACR